MEERLCPQWNDFQDNIQRAFWDMREDTYLTDVTLACKDGQQVEAHKQGCISCGMCSYPELTKDHVLTSAYVKFFRTVTRNAVNKSV